MRANAKRCVTYSKTIRKYVHELFPRTAFWFSLYQVEVNRFVDSGYFCAVTAVTNAYQVPGTCDLAVL